ncbi:AMP-binding protein [Gordonia sp. CPCC 205515]|uniref:class I adenylate-forming enzyme family protein n=1 Tax=Gordonia sp. CPCC 205515 TaxID=3140791 RepID=UPI003AF3AD63
MTEPVESGSAPFAPDDPNSVCGIEGDTQLTWAEWNDQANRLANALHDSGVRPGDVVAVRVRTRLEWLTISLAVAKLHAVIVAVNYHLTPTETAFILRDCKVRAAIVDDADPAPLVEHWRALDLAVIVSLDSVVDGTAGYDSMLTNGDNTHRPAADLARLIIYSSGTTGSPKGAPFGNWQNPPDEQVLREYQRSLAFDGGCGGPGNRMLINLPMHHGSGPGYARVSLATGGSVVFARRFDAEETLALIERHQITHWIAVPTMLERIFKLPAETLDRYDVSSLRFLQGGAAPFSVSLKQACNDYFGPVLYETYGATECGMIAGATPSDLASHPGTSGRPFRHVDVRIVDADGNPVTTGTAGEICVLSPQVIGGYIGRGPLGSDKIDADGYYHTGDVGYLDEDGLLYISDRIIDMIISGGVNIYPAEIEAVIATHPDVINVAVIGVPDDDRGEQPLAFIETRPGAEVTDRDIAEFCAGKLAKYKWPRHIEFIDEIPTNSMGKSLKRELRDRAPKRVTA